MPQHEHERFGMVEWTRGDKCPACLADELSAIAKRLMGIAEKEDAAIKDAIARLDKIGKSLS